MMKRLYITLVGIMFLVSGCTSMLGDREYKSGVVDYRMVANPVKKDGSASIIMKHFDFKNDNSYFKEGDYLDIRLSNIMYDENFDPSWLQKNKNKLINNIGVFVTIKEINSNSLNHTVYPNKTLVYTDNVYVKAKANQSFTPIYLSKYHGGDLELQLNVVEFDQKGKDSNRYLPLLDNIVKLSQNAISNGLIGKAVSTAGKHYLGMSDVNMLGSSLLDAFSNGHDDLITSYKLNLIAPNTVKNKNLHKLPYLKEGDIVFIRRKEGDENNKISNWKKFEFDTNTKTIKDTYRNSDGDVTKFKEYYSYIVLTIIKRKFKDTNRSVLKSVPKPKRFQTN